MYFLEMKALIVSPQTVSWYYDDMCKGKQSAIQYRTIMKLIRLMQWTPKIWRKNMRKSTLKWEGLWNMVDLRILEMGHFRCKISEYDI